MKDQAASVLVALKSGSTVIGDILLIFWKILGWGGSEHFANVKLITLVISGIWYSVKILEALCNLAVFV